MDSLSGWFYLLPGLLGGWLIGRESGYHRGVSAAKSETGRVDSILERMKELEVDIENLQIEQQILNNILENERRED